MSDSLFQLTSWWMPVSLLLAGGLCMFRTAWRCHGDRRAVRVLLCLVGLLELAVLSVRFGGMSLAARPWFGGFVRVVDPFLEWYALICAALLLVAAVFAGIACSLPWKERSGLPLFASHALMLLCMVGTLASLRPAAGPTVWSPDGAREACIIPSSCACGYEMTGVVVYRRCGDLMWRFIDALDEEDGVHTDWKFEWSADSTTIRWVPKERPAGAGRRSLFVVRVE